MNAFGLFGAGMDVDAIIKVVIFILIFIVPAIGKMVAAMRENKRPGMPQRPPAPPQQKVIPQPQQPRPAQPKSVKEEIEEFLQRTAQKKQVASGTPARRISQPSAPIAKQADVVLAETVGQQRPVGGDVSRHVKKFLDESQFDQRASKLGGDVVAADTKIEEHLKKVFGHGVGNLSTQGGESAVAPTSLPTGFFQDDVSSVSSAGTGIASLLSNINNLRQAIIVNEILQRPIDRWE
jgi:hypothetical protein